MQRKKLDFSLDQYDFDYLIAGTGLTESLYAAHLQKICRKKCLVIDQDDQYSSCIRTLNFKELSEFLNNLNPTFKQQQEIYQQLKQKQKEEEELKQKLIEQEKLQQEIQENDQNNEKENDQNQQEDSKNKNQSVQQEIKKEEVKQEEIQIQKEKKEEEIQYDIGQLNKKFSFFPVTLTQDKFNRNQDFSDFMINDPVNKYVFRRFNIDLQPKVIFSTSLTTDMMSQADMDKYMEFKAIQGIYHFDNVKSKFLLAPSGKSEIYKHKDLGLKEKKDMFNIIHKCIKLYYHHINYEIDQNSLQEFDKDYEIDEKTKKSFEEYKNQVCTEFLQKIGCSQKVMEIFMYTICNFDLDVINWKTSIFKPLIEKECTTLKFLGQIAKFIKSCGVHTSLPYLYTTYGTGDIPQGFSRIAAVFGGQFIINKNVSIFGLDIQENNQEKQNLQQEQQQEQQNKQIEEQQQEQIEDNKENSKIFQIDSNLTGAQETSNKINIKEGIIVGQEYTNSFLNNLLQNNNFEFSQHQVNNQDQKDNYTNINLLRINYITQKVDLEQEEDQIYDKCPPLLYYIPPQNKDIQNDHPIQIFQIDSDTNNAAKNYQVFQVKTVINSKYTNDQEYQQNLVDKIEQFIEQNIKISTVSGYSVKYSGAFLQNRNVWLKDDKELSLLLKPKSEELSHLKVLLTGQENFENDMDRNFSEFKENISLISDQFKDSDFNYFQTVKEMKGEEDYQEKQVDSDEDEDGLNKLINQFNDLKQNTKQEENNQNNEQENTQTQQENQENTQTQQENQENQQQEEKQNQVQDNKQEEKQQQEETQEEDYQNQTDNQQTD